MSHWIAAFGWAAVASFSAGAGDRAPVRERIQFSSPGESVDSPTARPKDELLSRTFEFLDRDNSISGVVQPLVAPAPHGLPNYPRNTRLLEVFDHKKNWIYLRSDDFNRSRTVDEMFGVRDWGQSDKKPRTALEIFFEDHGQRPARDGARETPGEWNGTGAKWGHSSRFDRAGTNFGSEHPFDSTRTLTAGFSLSADFFGASQSQGPLHDFRNAGLSDSLSNARVGAKRADEFQKLLAVPGTINPLLPSFDPINLQVDTTRREINPVTAQGLGPGAGGDASNPALSIGGAMGNGSRLLDDRSAKVLGSSSLSPVVAVPAETPYRQPKPAVLEFPKRKF